MTTSNYVQILDKKWWLAIDPDQRGELERWYEGYPKEEAMEAPVPGIIQQVYPNYHGVVWYRHEFHTAFKLERGENGRIKDSDDDEEVQIVE